MKQRNIYKILVIIPLLIMCEGMVCGQDSKAWDLGVTIGYGKDYYKRKYYEQAVIPGAQYNFQSHSSWGAGLIGEKHISSVLSFVGKLNYFTQKLDNSTLCNCDISVDWYQYERHHWASLGTGIRGYFNPMSSIKMFAEAGIQGDYFIGHTEALNHKKVFNRGAAGYNRFVPSINASLGSQWKRVGLVLEYQANLANTFQKDLKSPSGAQLETRKSITRQGLSVKAIFLIVRGKQ